MQVEVNAFGEGVTIPYVDIGLSIIRLSLYIEPNKYFRYECKSYDASQGSFAITTEKIYLPNITEEKEAKWYDLSNKVLFVKLKPSHFAIDEGVIEFEFTQSDYSTGDEQQEKLKFVSRKATGWSFVKDEISFKCDPVPYTLHIPVDA